MSKRTKEQEQPVEPITLDDAASNATAAILDNLLKYQSGERTCFEVYFYMSYPLHKIEHDNFITAIDPQPHPDKPEVIVAANGVELYMHHFGDGDENHLFYTDEATYRRRFLSAEA